MAGAAVSVRGVSRRFDLGPEQVWAVQNVSIAIASGEFLALIGRSGSGKTTLLNIIAGLDRPTEGDVLIDGRSVPSMSEAELTHLRRHTLGFVFQSFGLLPLLSAYENVELPLRIAGVRHGARGKRARHVLDMVGLGRRAEHRPYELSGGEQQRVAIARALAIQPSLILADEPTGELDSATATAIFTLMRDVARSEGVTIITSTHDRLVMEMADRIEELSNGRLVEARHPLRHVTERERSPFAAPLPLDAGALPSTPLAAPSPSALVGADASQFARPTPAQEPSMPTTDAVSEPPDKPVDDRSRRTAAEPPPARRQEEPAPDVDDDALRWAPPGRRT
jgi:putative ABC transport system ATP-binding protein